MQSTSLLLLCLLWSLVEVHSQTAPYLTFNDSLIPNHAYVDLSLMMYPGNGDTTAHISSTVICHTDLRPHAAEKKLDLTEVTGSSPMEAKCQELM